MAERLRLGIVGANPNVGWASRTHRLLEAIQRSSATGRSVRVDR